MSSRCRRGLFALLTGGVILTTTGASSATDLKVELCAKGDPTDRISGVLVERTRTQWIVVSKGRRTTVEQSDFDPCPDETVAVQPPTPPVVAQPPVIQPPGTLPTATLPTLTPKPPQKITDTEEIAFEGSGTVGVGILPYVVKGYAKSLGVTIKANQETTLFSGFGTGSYELFGTDTSKPFLRVTITANGSNNAFSALLGKRALVGQSSRPFSEGEIEKLLQVADQDRRTREQLERVVALDAIVIIAHPSNPIQSLELCQAARLFSGKITNWRDVGGARRAVTPYVRTGTSGTDQLFRQILEENCGETISQSAVPTVSWPELTRSIASDPNAISFAALPAVSASVKSLAIKGACGIEQSASRFTVKTEDYPLSRRLFLYTPYNLPRYSQGLLDYTTTPAAQSDVGQGHAVDQEIETMAQDLPDGSVIRDVQLERDDRALREFERDTRGAVRVSVTYRFQSNSDELDTKARQDIARLASYFQRNPTRKTVLLAGFADSFGGAGVNRELALKRAMVVRDALNAVGARLQAGSVEVKGYGEIQPVSCNDSDLGRARNRRVEVWLRP